LVIFFLTLFVGAQAQVHTVSGRVTDANNAAIPGTSVLKKGTTIGTSTDADGKYTLSVGANDVLTFSFIGYKSQEITVGARTLIDVSLETEVNELSEVVVTALGIQREEKSLGYAIGRVQGAEFTKVAR